MLGQGMIAGGASVTLGLGIRACLDATTRPWGIAGAVVGAIELLLAWRWL